MAVLTPQARAELTLPVPGSIVDLSPAFEPLLIKGIKINPANPLEFNFILDTGNAQVSQDDLRLESNRLIKYFLTAMAVPEKDLWVNLSPYEKNRIMSKHLDRTEMGRDMLAQDYILKQITASLIYPEKALGQKFWDKVYSATRNEHVAIPINTFNKVWIVADKADIVEQNNAAYVINAHLKVMLEEDYTALNNHQQTGQSHSAASEMIRQLVLPAIEEEVNSGKNFAPLRQMYYSMILASWYKMTVKNALMTQVFGNSNKVEGFNFSDSSLDPQSIYKRYLQAYKKGVFNYIKDESDPTTHQGIPRKYFSGGADFSALAKPEIFHHTQSVSQGFKGSAFSVIVDNAFKRDEAMTGLNKKESDELWRIWKGNQIEARPYLWLVDPKFEFIYIEKKDLGIFTFTPATMHPQEVGLSMSNPTMTLMLNRQGLNNFMLRLGAEKARQLALEVVERFGSPKTKEIFRVNAPSSDTQPVQDNKYNPNDTRMTKDFNNMANALKDHVIRFNNVMVTNVLDQVKQYKETHPKFFIDNLSTVAAILSILLEDDVPPSFKAQIARMITDGSISVKALKWMISNDYLSTIENKSGGSILLSALRSVGLINVENKTMWPVSAPKRESLLTMYADFNHIFALKDLPLNAKIKIIDFAVKKYDELFNDITLPVHSLRNEVAFIKDSAMRGSSDDNSDRFKKPNNMPPSSDIFQKKVSNKINDLSMKLWAYLITESLTQETVLDYAKQSSQDRLDIMNALTLLISNLEEKEDWEHKAIVEEYLQAVKDMAQTSPGGIDLDRNKMALNVHKDNNAINIQMDPALVQRIRTEGFDYLDFTIRSITPISIPNT